MKNVSIYTTPTCGYCRMAKDFFKEHNIAYTDYIVAEDSAKRKEMIEKSGQMGVPVMFIDNDMIIGFNEEKIKSALEI